MPRTALDLTIHLVDLPRVRAVLAAVTALSAEMRTRGDHRYDAHLTRIRAALEDAAAAPDAAPRTPSG